MKKRVLVTGGAGFLGSNLCEELIKRGNYVICLDNLFSGSKENIQHLLNNPNFEFIEHDIINPLFLEVDQIYNLACPASPRYYHLNPIKTLKCSTIGLLNMLELAKKNKSTILQASTSEIYGDALINPQDEEYNGNVNTIAPRSCYDEGKRVAETFMMDYYREHNVDIRIVRIFNTYGPKMSVDDGRFITNFLLSSLKNQEIPIYGDGNQTRSICYVDDLIRGIIMVMEGDEIMPFNIGNPTELTIIEIANLIKKLTDSYSTFKYYPLPIGDPKMRKPDISRIKKIYGWEPKIPPEIGIKLMRNYYIEYLKNHALKNLKNLEPLKREVIP